MSTHLHARHEKIILNEPVSGCNMCVGCHVELDQMSVHCLSRNFPTILMHGDLLAIVSLAARGRQRSYCCESY